MLNRRIWHLSALMLYTLLPLLAQAPVARYGPQQDGGDEAIYQWFFQKVIDLKNLSSNPRVTLSNGRSSAVIVPKLQDLIGLTDSQVEKLNSIAADCMAKLHSLMQRRPSVLEARLQRMESGQLSPALAKEFEEIDRERSRLLLTHIQDLTETVGNERFRVLDGFVHSSTWERKLMPSLSGPAVAPVQK